jgi:hypothetical protein
VSYFKESAMRRIAFALVAVAAVTALGGHSSPSAASGYYYDCDNYYFGHCRGWVVPCSLDGVNPAYHPSIFGNPRVAYEEYGFIRARDGTWHVERNCVRGVYHGG